MKQKNKLIWMYFAPRFYYVFLTKKKEDKSLNVTEYDDQTTTKRQGKAKRKKCKRFLRTQS